MKKRLSILLCLAAILLITPIFSVFAEPTTGSTTVTGSISTTESTGTEDGETTEPTDETDETTESTTGVDLADVSFFFTYNVDFSTVTASYSPEDSGGLIVEECSFNGKSYPVKDLGGSFLIDTYRYEAQPGLYAVSFRFSNGDSIYADKPLEVGTPGIDDLSMNISITISDNKVTAILTDQFGKRVPFYPIYLYIADSPSPAGDALETGIDGSVTFPHQLSNEIASVRCVAPPSDKLQPPLTMLSFKGAEKTHTLRTPTGPADPTTTSPATDPVKTTRKPEDETTTTKKKNTLVFGPDAYQDGDNMAIGFAYDKSLPALFGCSQSTFTENARLLLSKSVYDSIAGNSDANIMVMAMPSEMKINDQMLLNAISGKSEYSTHHSGETIRKILDLSLVYVNQEKTEVQPLNIPLEGVTIELPVPRDLSDEEQYKIAVSLLSADGQSIETLSQTTTEDDVLRFTVGRIGTIALLGFQPPTSYYQNSLPPALVFVILGIGVLFLGAAIFLLYFFFLRKVPVMVTAEGIQADAGAGELAFDEPAAFESEQDGGNLPDDDAQEGSPSESIPLSRFSEFSDDPKNND